MRTEALAYLIEISRHKSMTAASQELHISPQALSLAVKKLEEELGCQLLTRTAQGTSLTKEGTALVTASKRFFAAVHKINTPHYTQKTVPTFSGQLQLYATPGAAESLLPSAVTALYKDYPRLHVALIELEINEILSRLQQRDIEGAFIYYGTIDGKALNDIDLSPFVFVPLVVGKYLCCVPPQLPIAHYQSISLKTIRQYPTIVFQPSSAITLSILNYFGQHENIIFAQNMAMFQQLLLSGVGLGLTMRIKGSKALSLPVLSQLPTVALKENITSDFGFLYNKNDKLSHTTQQLIAYLKNHFDSQNASIDYPL